MVSELQHWLHNWEVKLNADNTGHQDLVPIISLAQRCQKHKEHCSRMLCRTSNQLGNDILSFTSHWVSHQEYFWIWYKHTSHSHELRSSSRTNCAALQTSNSTLLFPWAFGKAAHSPTDKAIYAAFCHRNALCSSYLDSSHLWNNPQNSGSVILISPRLLYFC